MIIPHLLQVIERTLDSAQNLDRRIKRRPQLPSKQSDAGTFIRPEQDIRH